MTTRQDVQDVLSVFETALSSSATTREELVACGGSLIAAARGALEGHHPMPAYLPASECGHAEDDDAWDESHRESDDRVMLCLANPTGFLCRDHYDSVGMQVEWPCDEYQALISALTGEPASRRHTSCHHQLYRLTCAEFDALRDRAEGCCEICRIPEAETSTRVLLIDYDGRYGWFVVRGLVCPPCNSLMRYVDREQKYDPRVARYLANAWFTRHTRQAAHPTVKRHRRAS